MNYATNSFNPLPIWSFKTIFILILNTRRYREKKWKMNTNTYGWRGLWQVKRGGARHGTEIKDDDITVYQEYQGTAAKQMILDLLSKIEHDESCIKQEKSILQSFEFDDIPHLDGADERLVPFLRFKTFRSCWQVTATIDGSNDFSGLKVDIDTTDMGYAVGEVEAIFESGTSEAAVELQKGNIRKLVDLLTNGQTKYINEEGASIVSIGKLEYYLQKNCEEHYDALIKAGAI
jgi:hypothetical protein